MESKENSLLRPARCGRCGEFFCFLVLGSWSGQRAGAGRGSVGFRDGAGRFGAVSVRAVRFSGLVQCQCSFHHNGMISSFLDESGFSGRLDLIILIF